MTDEVKAAIERAVNDPDGDGARIWLAGTLKALANEDAPVRMMARAAFECKSPVHGRHPGRWDKNLPQDEKIKREWIDEQRAALLALAREVEK